MLQSTVQQYVFWHNKENFLLDKDIDAHWIMYVIDNGCCQFEIGEIIGIACPGDILICPPYNHFSRKVLSPLDFHFFRFSLQNELLDTQLLKSHILIKEQNRVKSTCDMLKKVQYDDSIEIKRFRNHLLNDILLMYFYENTLIIQITTNKIKDDLIRNSVELLEDLSQDAPSIGDISDILNINHCHFSRKFKKIMGVSPIEYRNKIKLQEAQKRLIETNETIEEIASHCGYSNGFYFSRIFTQMMGQSPSSYRNNHKI